MKIGNYDALQCPNCAGEHLHHGEIEIYNRRIEDGSIDVVRVAGVTTSNRVALNGPGRRSSIAITMYCEECQFGCDDGGLTKIPQRLIVMQHKGSTYFEWITADDLTISEAPYGMPEQIQDGGDN